jgi:hypothetical protein
MGFFRRHKKLSATLLVVVIAVTAFVIRFAITFLPVPLVISKETTYITQPLRSDGSPDYLGALNQRLSEGVTPENNAAVLFWRAAGPGILPSQLRRHYFQMLGVPPPPETGEYFVAVDKWIDRHRPNESELVEKSFNNLSLAVTRPWSKQEFPVLAEWIAASSKPMELVMAGTKRPRRYDPLMLANEQEESLVNALLPDTQQCRDFARCLVARAMLRLKEGKADEAWSDLLACHRLARLTAEGPFFIDALVAIAIDGTASVGDYALLEHAKLTATQISKMRRDFAGLPPMPRIADLMDQSERFVVLDFALSMNRQITSQYGADMKKLGLSLTAGVDWNIVLRIINSWYDRLVTAVRKPTRAERQKAIDEVESDLKKEGAEAMNWKSLASLLLNRRKVASWRVGMIVSSLMMPAEGVVSTAEDRWTMQFEITKLALALAEYHAKHSRYPVRLITLAPKYLREVPKDIFNNDADLHYSRKGDGYLLYSVGENGKDDGGRGRDDAKNGEGWDDLAVRMSAVKP